MRWFQSVITKISSRLSVSPKLVSAGLLGLPLIIGTGGYWFFSNPPEVLETQFWVGDDEECKDWIAEAEDELGQADNQIPAPNGDGGFSVTVVDVQNGIPVVCWSGNRGNASAWVGSQRVVFDKWRDTGRKDDQGLCTINGNYLIACTMKYGNIGDQIDFYLDDGTKLPCIMADEKNPSDPGCTEWGHENGHNVLEFELTVDAWEAGNTTPGATNHTEWGGKRVAGWTNNGNVIGAGGVLDGADSALSDTKNSKAKNAIDECKAKENYDNSTLTAALVSYSFSQRHVQADSEPGTRLYQSVCEAVFGAGDVTASYHYHSCDRGVAAAIRWTGADLDFPAGAPNDQLIYCREHPELWEPVSSAQGVSIGGGDDWAESVGLQPGDIGMTPQDHTLAYVGHQAIEDGYNNTVKGTDGDIGEPTATSAWVMASAHQRAACMQDDSDGRPYYFFRYKGSYDGSSEYSDVGANVTLGSTKRKGTDCDCMKCEITGATEMAQFAVSIATGGVNTGAFTQEEAAAVGCSEVNGRLQVPDGGSGTNPRYGENGELDGFAPAQPMLTWWREEKQLGRNGLGTYGPASCSPWICSIIKKFELDDAIGERDTAASFIPEEDLLEYHNGSYNSISATGQWLYMMYRSDRYELVHCGTDKCAEVRGTSVDAPENADDICKPGDILCYGTPASNNSVGHILMYVGNELAKQKYPNTTGNAVESGEYGRFYPGLTKQTTIGGYDVFRLKTSNDSCEECEEEPGLNNVVEIAKTQLGVRYSFTGDGGYKPSYGSPKDPYAGKGCLNPNCGAHVGTSNPEFDCAGFVSWAYHMAGYTEVSICQGTYAGGMKEQIDQNGGHTTDPNQLRPGDLVFSGASWGSEAPGSRTTGHVGMYIGDGQVIHCAYEGVVIQPLAVAMPNFVGGGSPVGGNSSRASSSSSNSAKCNKTVPVSNTPSGEPTMSAADAAKYSDTDFTDTALIGDSVFSACVRNYAGSVMPGSSVYAKSGEPYSYVLNQVKAQAGKSKRIVIETGYNDPSALTYEQVKALADAAGNNCDVFFVTMYSAGSGISQERIDVTNGNMRRVANERSNVHIIDWYGRANGHPDWVEGENDALCHPKTTSVNGIIPAELLANMIKAAISPQSLGV